MKRLIISLLIVFIALFSYSQDPYFSHFNRTRIYQNPAFCGFSSSKEINLNYRNQWPKQFYNFITTYLSYDQNMKDRKSNFGFYCLYDIAGGKLFTTDLMANYAYKIQFSDKVSLVPGVGIGITSYRIDYSKLIFADGVHPRTGSFDTLYFGMDSYSKFNSIAGFLFNAGNFYFSASFNHIQGAEVFNSDDIIYTPLKYQFYSSYVFHISKDFLLIPSLEYLSQHQFLLACGKVQARFKDYLLGLRYSGTYSNASWLAFSGGYSFKHIGLVISLGIYQSDVSLQKSVSPELGLYYNFSKKEDRKFNPGLGLF